MYAEVDHLSLHVAPDALLSVCACAAVEIDQPQSFFFWLIGRMCRRRQPAAYGLDPSMQVSADGGESHARLGLGSSI